MTPPSLDATIGLKVRDHGGELYHIRGIVDGRAVLRSWSRSRQRWGYEVASPAAMRIVFIPQGWTYPAEWLA